MAPDGTGDEPAIRVADLAVRAARSRAPMRADRAGRPPRTAGAGGQRARKERQFKRCRGAVLAPPRPRQSQVQDIADMRIGSVPGEARNILPCPFGSPDNRSWSAPRLSPASGRTSDPSTVEPVAAAHRARNISEPRRNSRRPRVRRTPVVLSASVIAAESPAPSRSTAHPLIPPPSIVFADRALTEGVRPSLHNTLSRAPLAGALRSGARSRARSRRLPARFWDGRNAIWGGEADPAIALVCWRPLSDRRRRLPRATPASSNRSAGKPRRDRK